MYDYSLLCNCVPPPSSQHCSSSCDKCPCEEGDESDHCELCEVSISAVPNTENLFFFSETKASSFQPLCFLPGVLILLPLLHTVWHNLHTRLMLILCIYHCLFYLLFCPLWPDVCMHCFTRRPCRWTNWVPLSVRILIFHNALIFNCKLLLYPYLMIQQQEGTC